MKKAFTQTLKTFKTALPIMTGVLLLISLINSMFGDIYTKIFTGNLIIDSVIGAIAGSISFGIPITSFVTAGELLKQGVSLVAVTAFITTWTTVGTMMLPLEIPIFGKKFAIVRNIGNFFLSIIMAILVVITFGAVK